MFCGRGVKLFYSVLSFFILLSSKPKKYMYHKSSCCGPFETKALRDTKSVFLIPKSYDKHSGPFYILYKPYSKMAAILVFFCLLAK